jgi:hypothetical protein
MKLVLSIFLFFVTAIKLFACDCGPLEQLDTIRAQEYKNSDVIFTGRIISLSEGWEDYKIGVTESFKGNIKKGQILTGKNTIDCEPFINMGGDWLIYGKIVNDSLVINPCGLSRSFKYPYENRYFSTVPLPPVPAGRDSAYSEAKRIKTIVDRGKKYRFKASVELTEEIEKLRRKKRFNK